MAESLLHSESEALCQVCFKRDDACNGLIKPDQRNSLHHCRGCLLAVHKLCYGLSGDTDRMFFCERCCEVGPMSTQVISIQTCCVCGGENGAMKRAGDVWVHVTCALFSPDFKVQSFKEMRFECQQEIGKRQPLDCSICRRQSSDVLHCQSCSNGAHAICAFSSQSLSWDSCSLFSGQRQVVCPEHYDASKAHCICKRSFPEKEAFMICCDVCDTWYHGECVGLPQHVGSTLEKYTCGLCQTWLNIRSKLFKEDRGGPLFKFSPPEHLINLSLVDYLLAARIFEIRAGKYLKATSTPEELRDLLTLTKMFFFTHPFADSVLEKSTAANELVSSAQELFQKAKEDRIDCSDLPAIAELTESCNRLGLVLPQLVKLKALSEHVELIGKVKEFVASTQVHTLVEAKAFYEMVKERLGADSQWLVPLSAVINCADLWITDVKEAFAKSQTGEHKLTIEEAKKLLADSKSLTLSLPQEMRTVEEEIKAAELWDKNFRSLSRPYDPSQLSQLFDETNITTVWTTSMADAKVVLDRYNLWYGQALRYMNPTELTPLPTLEEVQQHIKKGETDLGTLVDIREARKQLESMLADALSWQDTARQALQGPSTQQRMSYLLREGKSLICTFSEMEAIERRAGINKKISDVLHRKHKEEDLILLLREAKELCADEEFIRAVEGKLDAANEIKSRVTCLLQSDILDPTESYTQLLEELKNSRTDLPDERAKLEDGFKSLKWLQTVKDTLEDTEDSKDSIKLKRKANDLETYKNLINKGLKITYKHPRAAALFDQLAAKYWDLECQKLNTTPEVTLDQLQSLEAKMTLVTHDPPESLVDFAHRIKGINKAVQYFETLLGLPLEQVFASDLTVLKTQITQNRKKLADEGVAFPEKFTKILPWTEWVDWCLEVQRILGSDEKPSVNKLYEVNEDAINLGIPLEVTALKELTEHISYYEKWLSRYSAYIVIKKYYKTLQVAPAAYLRKFQEKPKTSLAALQQLVEQAQGLKCKCDEEIAVLSTDIAEALAWVDKIKDYLKRHPYEELLQACKRSVARASESESYKELQRLTNEYLFSIFVDIDDYTNQLCTYSWHLTALQLLQQTEKINAEEWDEFFANLEFGNREYQDQIIFDRVRRQQSLRIQIEEDISKLMQAEKEGGSRQLSLDDIDQLNEQVLACKVMLKQDSYIHDLMQRAQSLIQRFQDLQEAKGWLADFKELQSDLAKLPIEIPDISQKVKDVIDKSSSLGLRFKILKESAVQMRSKIEKFKVENLLKEYAEAPSKVPEAEQFAESLEQAKVVLQEGQKATDSTSLELVTHTLSRLDSMIIHMGPAEASLRMVLWKLKVKLALEGHTKLPFQVLCGWYNEGLGMKDLDTLQEIGELERWVKKGEEMKTKLAAAESLDALERTTAETRDLPFDLTQSIIEQRTRITLMGAAAPVAHEPPPPKTTIPISSVDEYAPNAAYILSKRVKNPNVQEPYYYGGLSKDSNPAKDPMRSSAISAIENVLAAEASLSPSHARKFALKIEAILNRNKSQGKDYNKAVANIQRVLDRLQDFEGFSDKLIAHDIKCHRLCELHLSHLVKATQRNAQVVEELFGGTPKVFIRVNVKLMQMTKLKVTEPSPDVPVKKPKVAHPEEKKSAPKKSSSNFQDVLKAIRKEKKPVSPNSLAPSQPTASRPAPSTSHSLKDLINDFKQFKEQQGDSVFTKPKEADREATPDLRKTDPNAEYKQLSQFRLERAGFPKQEASFEPKKRHGDGLLEDPVKRSRHEDVPEGRFSSDSEELPDLKSINPAEKSEEYSVLDYAHRESSRRSKKKKGKMYDPLQSSAPKNKAPAGSLLKVWTGKVEYNKSSMVVDMFSIDNIEQFQHVPQLPSKLEIQGRTKQDELESYLSQSAGAGTHKSIITAWIEAGPGYEYAFRTMSRDLAEKDRAAVIRNDSALSIYITCLSDSFKTAMNALKINVLQRIDKSVAPHISEKEKLACVLVFKKSAAGPSNSLLDPTILAAADTSRSQDFEDEKSQDQPLSPITSEEDVEETDDSKVVLSIIAKLQNNEKLGIEDLNQLKQILEQNPSPEVSNLIATINSQIEQDKPRESEQRSENNVAQFLSQQHGAAKPQQRGYGYGYDQRRSSRFS